MQILNSNEDTIVRFETNSELIHFCDPNNYEFSYDMKQFIGEELRTWDEVTKRNDRDWAAALYDLDQCRKRIKKDVELPEMKSRVRRRKLSTDDGEFDAERYITGSERIFEDTKREQTTGNAEVIVVIDTSTNWTVDSENIFWKGAAGLTIAEILESKGYVTEIWAVNTVRDLFEGQVGKLTTAACIKRCQDPFDVSTMVNCLGGWFFRTSVLTLWKTIARRLHKTDVRYNLGYPTWMNAKMLETLTGFDDCAYIAGIDSFPGAVQVVMTTLERIKRATENRE